MSRAFVALVALTIASCTGSPVGPPRLPQVEQATEAIHGGGERYRAHRDCTSTAEQVDALLKCMNGAGWDFVPHGTTYPEPECWEARDRGQIDGIPPQCFVRSAAHRSGTAP